MNKSKNFSFDCFVLGFFFFFFKESAISGKIFFYEVKRTLTSALYQYIMTTCRVYSIVRYRYFFDIITFFFNKRPYLHLVSLLCKGPRYCKPCILKIWCAPYFELWWLQETLFSSFACCTNKFNLKSNSSVAKIVVTQYGRHLCNSLPSSFWLLVTEETFVAQTTSSFIDQVQKIK